MLNPWVMRFTVTVLLVLIAAQLAAFMPVSVPSHSSFNSTLIGPVVQTEYGPVRGWKSKAGVSVFHGVPFAAPPIGPLRWMPPQRAVPWRKTKLALVPGAWCTQLDVIKHERFGREARTRRRRAARRANACHIAPDLSTPCRTAPNQSTAPHRIALNRLARALRALRRVASRRD